MSMRVKLGLFLLAAVLSFTANAPAQDPNFYVFLCFGQSNVVSSAGCTCNSDHMHFNSAGSREFGKRYGEKMLALLGQKPAEPKQ